MHPENLVNSVSQNHWRQFHPILVTDVNGFVDMLIRFWSQKVKDQGHSRQWHENLMNTISQKPMNGISPSFGHRCIWVHRIVDYLFLGEWVTDSLIEHAIFLHGLASNGGHKRNEIRLTGSLGVDNDARILNTRIAQRKCAIPHSTMNNMTSVTLNDDT